MSQFNCPASAHANRGYRRDRDLPGLIALWPHEINVVSEADCRRLVSLLRRALRRERQRGLAGHWTYDVARHASLLAAYRHESAALIASVRARARPSLSAPRAE